MERLSLHNPKLALANKSLNFTNQRGSFLNNQNSKDEIHWKLNSHKDTLNSLDAGSEVLYNHDLDRVSLLDHSTSIFYQTLPVESTLNNLML